jgi:hypothetical protein
MIRAVYKRIAMLPLLLTLEPQEVVNPDDGKKKTVRCLHLRIKGSLRDLLLEAAKPVTELLLPAPSEDEAPMDIENNKEPMSPEEAESLKKALFAEEASLPEPVNKPQSLPIGIRSIEPGQINALIVLTGATDEADLRVKAERLLGRPLTRLTDMSFKEAAEWIEKCQPVKKGGKR